jgi:deoxyribose-phosphate aldolase
MTDKTPLNKYIDHTLLRANAQESEIAELCQEAMEYNFFSVCVNPRWISFTRDLLKLSDVLSISVIGFPLGANTLSIKEKECENALKLGAQEIDMVLDLQNVFCADWKAVENEIKKISALCGRLPLKVIIETAYLDKTQIKEASKCCLFGGASFVKTSTGFAPSGAKEEDLRIIQEAVAPTLGIKASGGIKTLADAQRMIAAGATRLGCSASVEIYKEWAQR